MRVTTACDENSPHIAPYAATLRHVAVRDRRLALWCVADLEQHVDRAALLGVVDPPEPPYWAHLWTGARVLAEALEPGARTAIELGCGLGLPGLVATAYGARVTFVDRIPAALACVRASAQANRFPTPDVIAADFVTPAIGRRFDLVLAAEVLYDRPAFGAVARAVARLLAPGGRALIADPQRIDTAAFSDALTAAGLRWQVTERPCREEGLPVSVRLIDARCG